MITIQEAWQLGRAKLAASPSPLLDARLLLAHVLDQDHVYLVTHYDQLLTGGQYTSYQHLIHRATHNEPIPYLVGKAHFFGQEFNVTPAVLIPRPETEQLVELAIEWGRSRDHLRIIDVGTGSACIAASLAAHLSQAEITGSDISTAALMVASLNAAQLAPGRVNLVQADLLKPFSSGIDLIVANLPYVAAHEWSELADGVKFFEPAIALRGGPDGLNLIRRLLPQARERLTPGGMVILEIGWQQGDASRNLAREVFPDAEIEVIIDFAGLDRLVVIRTGKL
ncbi:MAG: peptide chain release factor N(5)-glutamine methyltransferase [Chloroflexota bacterium]